MNKKLILITGGSASGKTHMANELMKIFKGKATLLSQDRFYKDTQDSNANFDVPASMDFKLQKEVLKSLLKGEKTKVPNYNFEKHTRDGYEEIIPNEFIILEGIFSLYDYELSELADFKIFVDTPSDIRLSRRIIRDTKERGRELSSIIERWLKDVKPSHNKYIQSVKIYADVIIPWHKLKPRALKAMVATITQLGKSNEELL